MAIPHRHNLLALLLLGLFSAFPAGAMTYRDNMVKVPVNGGYTNLYGTFTIRSYSITPGQDPKGHIHSGLMQSFSRDDDTMTWSIGRRESSTVGDWWKSNISANQNTFNDNPRELNFAFLGTLTLELSGGILKTNRDTYTLTDIAIAQGHAAPTTNNWWFGGKNCVHQSGNKVKCTGTSTAGYPVYFYFQRGGNPIDEIKLTEIEFPKYTLFPLRSRYRGENTACVWQPTSKCPPFVTYYNSTQAATVKLTVRNNLLYNSVGGLFDTSEADPSHSGFRAAIFVMDENSNIYASYLHKAGLFHHSTFRQGTSVASAGELVVQKGEIRLMTNCSGHYLPSSRAYNQLLEGLHRQEYTRSFSFDDCSDRQPDPQTMATDPPH